MITTFQKPDLKAPRCRSGVHILLNNNFLKEFQEKHPQHSELTLRGMTNILQVFHGKMWQHSTTHRDGVELPESLGYIFIGTCKSPKKQNTDYGNSIKSGELRLRHKNFESDNYLAKIFYTNFFNKYSFRNREMWKFTATRTFKRTVANVYPENWKIYLQVENGQKISRYMKNMAKNNYMRKRTNSFEAGDVYNEFDLN